MQNLSEDRIGLDAFLAEAAQALGTAGVVSARHEVDRYERNVSAFRKEIGAVVYPANRAAVQRVVEMARVHQVKLWPISRGKNWGLGSKLPARDGCVVVDLSRMDRIVRIDEDFGYATIEPGVSQGLLARTLRENGSRFFLDVTGSGLESSVVGNALERGVAYNTLRAETILGMEVVLGNGRVLRTGFGHFDQAEVLAPLFKFGIGPALDGLFFQSNFGIVTRITVQLLPRPEADAAFFIRLADDDLLPPLVDTLRRLKQAGVLRSVVHIANRRRSTITLAPLLHAELARQGKHVSPDAAERMLPFTNAWTAIGNIMGPPRMVRYALRRVRRELAPLGTVRSVNRKKIQAAKSVFRLLGMDRMRAILSVQEMLYGLNMGAPTNATLSSISWPAGLREDVDVDPDEGAAGLLWALPIIPMQGEAVRTFRATLASIEREHGFDLAVTLNLCHDRALEGVISLSFLRSDEGRSSAAFACIRDMTQRLMVQGFYPYRTDIQNMDLVVHEDDPFWQTVRDLKSVLDPDGVIAPGRFNLV